MSKKLKRHNPDEDVTGSVPLTKVIYTSVMATSMQKSPPKYSFFKGHPCIFHQNNEKPHSTHITITITRLSKNKVLVLEWPGYTPDLS